MNDKREKKIRGYMASIRKYTDTLPTGLKLKISNKLDRISLELKKDRQ